jgi:hypothetical protein
MNSPHATMPPTLITVGATHLTTIAFLHIEPEGQDALTAVVTDAASRMTGP